MDDTIRSLIPDATAEEASAFMAADPTAANNLSVFLTRIQQDMAMVVQLLSDVPATRGAAIERLDEVRALVVGAAMASIYTSNGSRQVPVVAPPDTAVPSPAPAAVDGPAPVQRAADLVSLPPELDPGQPATDALPDGYVAPDADPAADLPQSTVDALTADLAPAPATQLIPGRDHPIDQPPPPQA